MNRKFSNAFVRHGKAAGLRDVLPDIWHLFGGAAVLAEPGIHNFAIAIEQSNDMQMIIDRAGNIRYVNAAFENITGFSKAEVIGRPFSMLRSDLQQAGHFDALWNSLLAGHAFSGILANRKRNGEVFHVEKSISPIRDEAGNITHFFETGRDVTERVNELEHLRRLANYDSLTGLPNRNLFMDRIQHELSRAIRGGRQMALFFLDLDHFKQVNDLFGHAAGDELLQSVALRLKQCMREEDTVARLSGDEFAMIQVDVGGLDSVKVALDKIIESFRPSFHFAGQSLVESVSIGASIFPHDGVEVSDLLRCADTAMYRAKISGGNGYSFYSDRNGVPDDVMARSGARQASCWWGSAGGQK